MSELSNIRQGVQLVIVCGGLDEQLFLSAFCEAAYSREARSRIQIFSAEGIADIPRSIRRIENFIDESGYGLPYFAVVRDAGTDEQAAMQSIRTAFEKTDCRTTIANPGIWYEETEESLWTGMHMGYLLLPTCDQNPTAGTLEDLALSTVKGDSASTHMRQVDDFLQNVQKEQGLDAFRQLHKNRLYAYLAGTDTYMGMKIGEAAKAGAFDWDAPQYDFMKGFFRQALQ